MSELTYEDHVQRENLEVERLSKSLAEYQYSPLEPGHIRVLHLQPGDIGEPLVGSLVHELLTSGFSLVYHAISYAWGPPVFSKSIILDGRLLRITESLHSALGALRNDPPYSDYDDEDGSPFSVSDDDRVYIPLWVDAICINQKHNDEKNVQVALMARIFSLAQSVQVWLGEATPYDRLAFWMVRCIVEFPVQYSTADRNHRQDFERHYGSWRTIHIDEVSGCFDATFLQIPGSVEKECFKAIVMLSLRPWFHRLWVVQEVTSGDWDCINVRCGHLSVTFDHLYKFMLHCTERFGSWEHEDVLSDESYAVSTRLFSRWRDLLEWFSPDFHPPAYRLLDVLYNIDGFEVSDKRDMIYAIRNLVVAEESKDLLPNYGLTLSQLCLQVAQFILTAGPYTGKSGNKPKETVLLSMLAIPAVQSDLGMAALPSWVVDLGAWGHSCSMKLLHYIRESENNAAGGPGPCIFSFDRPSVTLLAVGCILTDVVSVLTNSEYPMHNLSIRSTSFKWDEYLARVILWRERCVTFLATSNVTPAVEPLASFLQQGATYFLKSFSQVELTCLLDRNKHRWELESQQELLSIVSHLEAQDIERFLAEGEDIRHLDTTRILMRTSDGKVGWGPKNTQTGDLLALMRGAAFPFILRPLGGDHYSIVGDAYINGIMQGEACPKNDGDWIPLIIE